MASPYQSRTSMESSSVLSPIISPSASYVDLSAYNPPASRSTRQRRRESTASSIFSLNSSVGTVIDWKTPKEYAISTLVENPNSRSLPPRPTTRDIPAVTLTPIPKVKASEFAPYLTISAEYEKYLRAKDLGLEEHIRLSKVESPILTPSPSFVELVESKLLGHTRSASQQQEVDSYPQSTTTSTPLNGSPKRPKRSLAITPLNTVPSVYFDENFRLENPRTFDVVSEKSEVIRSSNDDSASSSTSSGVSGGAAGGTRKALATNAILQEKLSWYMDTVEVHLISSISHASSSFFAALGDLRELHSEAAASVDKIQRLRSELTELDKEQAIKGLEIVRLRKRRNNVAKLEAAVKQMKKLLDTVKSVGVDLEKGNIQAALDGVDSAENILIGKPPVRQTPSGENASSIDLTKVKALETVKTEIAHLRHRVGKVFEARFVDTLRKDLQNHVENHLDGLQRARAINQAIAAYQEAVLRETKNLIRRNMPSDDDDSSVLSNMTLRSRGGRTAQEKSAKLAQALRNLGPVEAEDLLFRCYCGVSELVRRLGSQQKLLLDLTSEMGEMGVGGMLSPRLVQNGFVNGSPGRNGELEDSITAGFSDLISPALDIAQATLLKIIRARNEQTVRYRDVDFLRYFALNKLFFAECEAVSGRVGVTGLQTLIGNQIKDFLSNYHKETTANLVSTLEKDKWGAKDCDERVQDALDRIVDSATKDPELWLRHAKIFEDTRDIGAYESAPALRPNGIGNGTESGTGTGAGTPADGAAAPAKVRSAMVDEMPFILPESSLRVLQGVERYEELIVMMPGATSDIATQMLDFLRIFNSRACQLILGAGATKSAGLKNITTKHLALASQGLSIIITLMPYLRELSRRHGGSSAATLTTEFDKVKRPSKLTLFVFNRPTKTTKKKSTPSSSPSFKETTTLYRVLSRHLPAQTLQSIMGPVFRVYKEKLMEAYGGVELKGEREKEKMLRDAEWFQEGMGKLEGGGEVGEIIVELVRGKEVKGGGAGEQEEGRKEARRREKSRRQRMGQGWREL
ncbi:Vps54-like protein-domain-containing protein [Kalaharituber pfeilii]|nr:Vps54-like protein-domain-containing protein [Kalaharituber pfeilii]